MNDLVYQDQSADELRLTLCMGSLDQNQFTILQSGTLQTSFGTINAGIIGASHFLHFDFGCGDNLYEIFACIDVESPGKLFNYGPFLDDIGQVDRIFFNKISYSFNLQRSTMAVGRAEMERIEADIYAKNQGLGLVYTFPQTETSKLITAKTIVLVQEVSQNQWHIKTVHAYPNDQQLVFTNTTIMEGSTK
jgi:hypothetical protein